MDEVFCHFDGEITSNGTGGRILRVGGTHEVSNDLVGLTRSLDYEEEGGATRDESHEIVEEGLTCVLAVVLLGGGAIDRPELCGNDTEVAALKAREDFTNEASFDGVGSASVIHPPTGVVPQTGL